jgi:hypothetical protein
MHPVCSVRSGDRIFVVCSDRLVPANASVLTPSHIQILSQVTQTLFPGADHEQVGYKRQIGVKLGKSRSVYMDYVVAVNNERFLGRRGAIVEIQGGGETSNTGTLTRHISAWAADLNRTNAMLRNPLSKVGLIPNNAWKRQLEQITRKQPYAAEFGGGFALVMGSLLYDYVDANVPGGRAYFPDWQVALVELQEELLQHKPSGAVPFTVGKSRFLTYPEFIASLTSTAMRNDLPNPFLGDYTSLTNDTFTLSEF